MLLLLQYVIGTCITSADTHFIIFIVKQRHDVCTNTTQPLFDWNRCLSENERMLRSQHNEEKSNSGVWILDFYVRLAVCELHARHGLLESLLCRR